MFLIIHIQYVSMHPSIIFYYFELKIAVFFQDKHHVFFIYF